MTADSPSRFFAELYRRNPLLALIGWLHVVALVACAVAYLSDERLVMGLNAWIEPMKFMGSAVIYVWTIAWFTRYIRRPRPAMKAVSLVIAGAVCIQGACILLQAARGTRAYFNTATDFDAAVFATIVTMAAINLLMVAVVLVRFARPVARLAVPYLWGIRAGIVSFLAGGAVGWVMIVHGAHTVGAPDGGPGVPFLNWSTVAGDLRIARGMALHGMQLLPLVGWGLSRWRGAAGDGLRLAVLALVVAAYAVLGYASFREAMRGHPLLHAFSAPAHVAPVQDAGNQTELRPRPGAGSGSRDRRGGASAAGQAAPRVVQGFAGRPASGQRRAVRLRPGDPSPPPRLRARHAGNSARGSS